MNTEELSNDKDSEEPLYKELKKLSRLGLWLYPITAIVGIILFWRLCSHFFG